MLSRRRLFHVGLGAAVASCASLEKQSFGAGDRLQNPHPSLTASATAGFTSLAQVAARKNILYGAASDYAMLSSDAAFAAEYLENCAALVPENGLKWRALRPSPEQFDFTKSDWLFNFAETHNLAMRGHALVWHLSMPGWFKETVNRRNAESSLVRHIEAVAGRYAGKVHSWDVVNEAIEIPDGRSDGLRNTPWLEFLGEDYIDLSFRVAEQADPTALRVYNDYGLQYDTTSHNAKRGAALNLLERMQAKGTPIQAFGIQSHLRASETRFNAEKLRRFLRDIASMGLKILITELDVSDQGLPADLEDRDRRVADAYRAYLDVVLDEPAVIAVLTWGLSDRYTWLAEFKPREDGLPVRPLPLDENLERKLAWGAIAQAFDQAPAR
ncbi:MAG: endo-1,4-beta-xylanase [Cyanobacteria bacterium J069]|nr:MAG: glycosyl hydrolase family 10 [Cyanobacteria bacterium J069]